jgi:hypothetical protein
MRKRVLRDCVSEHAQRECDALSSRTTGVPRPANAGAARLVRLIPVLVLLAVLGESVVRAAESLPDAIAEQVLYSQGKQVSTSRIWVLGGRVRSETTIGGQTMTTLIDRGAKKIWVLMPTPVGCVEQPLDESVATNPLAPMPKDATEELVGTETIDGHPTQKYKMKATVGGRTREHYQWRATDLDGFPIRTAAVDGSYEQRFTKVELKKPDAKLFVEPAHCRSMPAVGGPMPSGRDRP